VIPGKRKFFLLPAEIFAPDEIEAKGRVVIAIRGDEARPNRMAAGYLERREELPVLLEAGT